MNEIEFYPSLIKFEGKQRYLLWQTSDDYDCVVLGEDGMMLNFDTIELLIAHAEKLHIVVVSDQEPQCLDLDLLDAWLKDPQTKTVKPKLFLNAWNLFTDVQSAINRKNMDREDNAYPRLYDKLFWSNNLPIFTPVGRALHPKWTK
ncbi:MAG TPA: hypothetical protein V6C76_06545 [Drouetiella sp.]